MMTKTCDKVLYSADGESAGILLEPVLIDVKNAAKVLGISVRHFYSLENSGRIGPLPVKLGTRKLFVMSELRSWAKQGCPPRQKWQGKVEKIDVD